VLLLAGGLAPAFDPPVRSAAEANPWLKADEGKTGQRSGSTLITIPETKQMLLIGPAKDAPYVQAFNPATRTWSDFAATAPIKDGIHSYYQTAYDPNTQTVYCLSGGTVLYAFHTREKKWTALPPAPELEGLSWQALACDPAGKRLVLVGSDKKADNLGWLRTLVFDIPTGKWQRLDVSDDRVQKEHEELVAAREALIDLGGRIRLAWYRDPKGTGSEAERANLQERGAALKKHAPMQPFAADVDALTAMLTGKKTLEALKSARALQRKLEERSETQYSVPCSRRNSPLVFDAKNRLFVLFGGDHEDYLMNDTWVLDLDRKAWRRARPDPSPTPRAGHALVFLPGCGKIALYEGYIQSNSTDYAAAPYRPLDPLQLWLYDVRADHWDLAGTWPLPGKGDTASVAPVGHFYGYSAQYFSPPALAADATDTLVLAGADTNGLWPWGWNRPSTTWTLRVDPAKVDEAGRGRLGMAANQRQYRVSAFRADFGEVAEVPQDTELDRLPDNQWVKLPPAPRNPCRGCRQRDWSTSVWDSDRDQILLWGGGHCVRSASTVTHYSPVSGRAVEGFDADEPYGGNGGGGFDSSLWNRPWVSPHNYKHYAYDTKSRLLVSARGYLYDPERMDWLRMEPLPLPYRFEWGATAVAASRHGVVVWARKKKGEEAGLWLFDRDKGWIDLEPKGKLFVPWCDSHGLVYDSKRDRMIFSSVGGGYSKTSNGTFLTFDFATKALEVLRPENANLAKTGCARELAYAEHADWMLLGDNVREGDPKTAKNYTRIYDCARNKMVLLDAGPVPDGHEVGWMYDAHRKLVYAFTTKGEAWAIKINPETARVLKNSP
jgi:hypothetical protein